MRKIQLLEADLESAEDRAEELSTRCKEAEGEAEEAKREKGQLSRQIENLESKTLLLEQIQVTSNSPQSMDYIF